MMLWENTRLAFTALWANKSRSLLTMLGIIIGISSVIAIMTVGNSLSSNISSSMQDMGANNIIVGLQARENEEEQSEEGYVFGADSNTPVSVSDDDQITDEMIQGYREKYADLIAGISLTESVGSNTAKDGQEYANLTTSGVNNYYFKSESIELLAGRTFTEKDQEDGRKVTIVSDRLVDNLFDGDKSAALGRTIDVYGSGEGSIEYTIVGIYKYEATGMALFTANDYDAQTAMYIPLKTAMNVNHSSGGYTQLTIVTNIGVDSNDFANHTKNYFNRYYTKNSNYNISAFSMAAMMENVSSMLDSISIAISIVAGISLLVGGIGVMNIMLVSITERTREIGTRKALGAKNASIRAQFIIEAIVLCLVGGVIGILLGMVLGSWGSSLLGFPTIPSIESIIVSVTFSVFIGVFFGYYPANKAAKLNPIDALRYE